MLKKKIISTNNVATENECDGEKPYNNRQPK